ncbi:MAG: hypothetical protein J6N51_07460 [Selenomonas sp.]|nr:hypothetical protein [Selenomonas sp.]
MHRWKLVITADAFPFVISWEHPEIVAMIIQHTILYCDELIAIYRGSENCDVITAFISSVANSAEWTIEKIKEKSSNTNKKDNIYTRLMQLSKQNGLLIIDPSEHSIVNKKIKRVSSSELVSNNDNLLAMYSFPYACTINSSRDMRFYIRWITKILNNERSIQIIDRYAFTSEGLEGLEKVLEIVGENASVDIYCDNSSCSDGEIKGICRGKLKNYKIKVYRCSGMHSRWIQAQSFYINLDYGIQMVNPNANIKKLQGSTYLMNKGTRDGIPTSCREICLSDINTQ